ncbi:MAG: AAA family ATPase [Candidatus Bathyarchaeia archaeon]
MKLIKTLIPFSEEYVPNEIVDREVEKLELKRFLKPLSENQIQLYNLLVTGSVGVGKTLLTKFIIRELPSHAIYIKLTEVDNTFFRILNKLVIMTGAPLSVLGRYSNIAFMKFIHYLDEIGSAKQTSTLFVLDDFDKIPIKAIRPILHEIPRSTNWCNFLIISRVPSVLEELPADTKSTLKCRELPLKPYNKETLYQIVKERAQLALKSPNAVDEKVLTGIAEASALSGSAREAIDILKTACLLAENHEEEKVTLTHLEEAMAEIERRSIEETISSLPIYHRLILQCCETFPQTYENVYKKWKSKLAEKNLKDLSIYRFRDFVADLRKLDLIRPDIKGHGRGRGFSYYLQLSPHIKKVDMKNSCW